MTQETVSVRVNKSFILKLLINVAVCLIGLAFFLASFGVARGIQQVVGADEYSRFLSILLMVFGVLGVGRSVVDFRNGLFEDFELKLFIDMRRAGTRIVTLFLLLVLNIALIRVIGYFEAGFVFMTLSIFFLGARTPKRFGTSLLFAAGITLIIYVVFGIVLNIYLPRGLIFN